MDHERFALVPAAGASKSSAGPRGLKLVIVESPAKARTIAKYLGAGYEVRASNGHVRDLPKSKLGVDSQVISYKEFFAAMDKVSSDTAARDQARRVLAMRTRARPAPANTSLVRRLPIPECRSIS